MFLGDKVKWRGAGNRGTIITRSGVVVMIVPRGERPQLSHLMLYASVRIDDMSPRTMESYVVMVEDHKCRRSLFWPRAHLLEHIIDRGKRYDLHSIGVI